MISGGGSFLVCLATRDQDQGWGGGQLEGRPIAGVGLRVATRAH